MPELPDVEAVRRNLVGAGIVGLRFTGATILWAKAIKTPPLEDFVLGVMGRCVREVGRRAKFLLFRLDNGQSLVAHLRMTGSLLMRSESEPRHRMTRNYFSLDDGRELLFVDPRKLGMLWLVDDEGPLLNGLGPEPLEREFTAEVLGRILDGRKAPVKALLCDQGLIAGIGNIYADEVLFACGVHPLTPGVALTTRQVSALRDEIVDALSQAVERLAPLALMGGPPTESKEGLLALRVPRKKGEGCSNCGTAIERVPVRGRSTYFCGRCQPSTN